MRAFVGHERDLSTGQVAQAIGAVLAEHMDVDVGLLSETDQPSPHAYDVLVIGAWADSASLAEWIAGMRPPRSLVSAAFDVRGRPLGFRRNAASAATSQLRRLAGPSVARPRTFHVGPDDELLRGELERAQKWGSTLAVLSGARRYIAPNLWMPTQEPRVSRTRERTRR